MASALWATIWLCAAVPAPKPRLPAKHAVVIGAGMSGLAVAGRLARAGLRVTVLEQNGRERAGGRLGEQTLETPDGHRLRFETGASLLLLPRVYARTFSDLGLQLPAPLVRVNPSYRVFLDDNLLDSRGPIDLGGGDVRALEARLALEVEEPEAARKVCAFFASARANLAAGLPLFIENNVRAGAPSLPEFVGQALRFWPLQNQAAQLGALFPSSPRLRALLSFDSLYVGLSPYAAPAVFSLLAALECDHWPAAPTPASAPAVAGGADPAGAAGGADPSVRTNGVWYARGGLAQIARALATGVEAMAGVEVRYSAAAQRIATSEGRGARARATGVELASGELVEADLVVCSADLSAAEPALLPVRLCRSRYEPPPGGKTEYSSSSVTFLWAVRRRRSEGGAEGSGGARVPPGEAETDVLRHHNVFLAADGGGADGGADGRGDPFRAAWDSILPPGGAQGAFPPACGKAHIYVCVSARTDPSACASGESGGPAQKSGASGAAYAYDNLMVLVPVPALDESWSAAEEAENVARWTEAARELSLRALERAGCAHVRADLAAEAAITPLDWRARYGLRRGAVFGLSHGLAQLSVLRPGQTSARVDGLFFAGASAQPGNGVPLVLISAQQAAAHALRWAGRQR